MPTDEYVVSRAEQEQPTEEQHSHRVRIYLDASVWPFFETLQERNLFLVPSPFEAGEPHELLADAIMGQVIENAASAVRAASWGVTGQRLWSSLARGSYVGNLARYVGITHRPIVYAGTAQSAPIWISWGDELGEEEEFEPVLDRITSYDVLLVSRATSLDLTKSELLPQFEDDTD
jgi:hypothetical protein